MKSRLLFAFAVVAAIASAAVAQMQESMTVQVVEVPVNVVGRDGKAVRGLTEANFELWDDGQKRPITAFDTIDFSSAEAARTTATTPINPAARRNFLVLFDLSYSNPNSLRRAQSAAREFVSKLVRSRDRVGVATFDVEHGFRLLSAFTTDRDLVQRAIADPGGFNASDPLQVTALGPTWRPEPDNPELGHLNPDGGRYAVGAGVSSVQRDINRKSAEFDDQYRTNQIDREIEILSMISRTMNTIVGKKEIILLSEGFDPKLVQGVKPLSRETEQDQVDIQRGEIWKVNTDRTYGSNNSQSLLSRFSDMCRRSDVVLHAIDIKGLRGVTDDGSRGPDADWGMTGASNEGLHLLANAGGGEVFKNSNDIASSFDRMMKAQEVTYILAFRGQTSSPGAFHNIKVKVVDVPAGTRVSHRSGYYEAGAGTPAERILATAEIMVNDIPQQDLHVDALPSIFPRTGERAAVPVVVDIDGPDLLRLKDDPIVVAEVYVYAFASDGTVRDSLYQRLTIDTEKLAAKLSAGGIKYLGTLALPPGQYAIKTLVRLPELDRNGFVRRDLVVPENNQIALSPPLFFDDASRWVMVKGTSHDAGGMYPFVVGDSEFVPSAAAHLTAGQKKRFAVFVAHAAKDSEVDVTPSASLVGRTGDAFIFDIDPPKTTMGSLEVTLKGSPLKAAVPVR